MNAQSIIAVVIVAALLFLAIRYIWREKKKGTKCIGCAMAGECQRYKKDEKE